jgi:delta 1-pyrroline-5-carboxylate dehydrogenase
MIRPPKLQPLCSRTDVVRHVLVMPGESVAGHVFIAAVSDSLPQFLANALSSAMSKYDTQLFINGKFVNSSSGKTFPVINPATEELICHVQEAQPEDVDLAVKAANDAFEPWRSMSGPNRRDLMHKLANLIEKNKAELAALESLNNGKPESQKNGKSSH